MFGAVVGVALTALFYWHRSRLARISEAGRKGMTFDEQIRP
jgi:hypothetical protein